MDSVHSALIIIAILEGLPRMNSMDVIHTLLTIATLAVVALAYRATGFMP